MSTPDLSPVRSIVARDNGLASVSIVRADGTPHASLVNAGVLDHPTTGRQVVGYVTYGPVKLRNLRDRPATSILWRAGWQWVGVDGVSQLIGPDDPADGIDAEGLRLLLRAVFSGAGGTHDDWDTYDRVMREEGRVAVLVEPERVYGTYSS
ncbi:TIGR03618 family F420-dependent PPOX class oxidoreductase [Pseudonocardia sp. DSM 110487]|uniref:TIGR03618 family F420-dependent PPOX class oxidoreductase n=1 Tax=Pseudonocardia sp. DSM 110487 TaxID=2865833 RepID=UPI001C6A4DC8|nr:TIGR03618 family F420-dependent PPOX class oxidoreductase [Pseudonocardia sp. DSM 110487]QYN37323.1 TIGR03618 family F420-dependent PPOX class oxidoreductase [Pseudonocardia sp. DSM 110487]